MFGGRRSGELNSLLAEGGRPQRFTMMRKHIHLPAGVLLLWNNGKAEH